VRTTGTYRQVTVTGTWSRTDTTRFDVNFYRRRMRSRARDVGGAFDATCPYKGQPDDGSLHGTFTFTVRLSSCQNEGKVVRHILEALALSTMCRPPKLKFDREFQADWHYPMRINGTRRETEVAV